MKTYYIIDKETFNYVTIKRLEITPNEFNDFHLTIENIEKLYQNNNEPKIFNKRDLIVMSMNDKYCHIVYGMYIKTENTISFDYWYGKNDSNLYRKMIRKDKITKILKYGNSSK